MPNGIPERCWWIEDEISDRNATISALQADRQQATTDEATIIVRNINALQSQVKDWRALLEQCVAGPISNLSITGIEITQATQFFNFNGQGSGSAPDNSVPLVANKPMILRVYVDRAQSPQLPIPQTITGRVLFKDRYIPPLTAPIAGRASSAIDRGNVGHTLNFWIPPELCSAGAVNFTVTVFDPTLPRTNVTTSQGRPALPVIASSSGPESRTIFFDPVPRLRIHGVLIRYTGLGLNIAPPSGQALDNYLWMVRRAYPISAINFTALEERPFNGDITNETGGGCGTVWGQLVDMLWMMRSTSGTSDIFVGLLPELRFIVQSPPASQKLEDANILGCARYGGAAATRPTIFTGATFAQEIGHALDQKHAPCGNPPDVDTSYPTWGGKYPSGSIGEFGFDNLDLSVSNPAVTRDFMSYCPPELWISPYTYIALKNAIATKFAAASLAARGEVESVEREYLYLRFRVDRTNRVELLPSLHLPAPAPPPAAGMQTPISCHLLDEGGRIVEFHRCQLDDPYQNPNDPQLTLRVVIPWHEEVRAIAFLRDGEPIHTVDIEEQAPEVDIQGIRRVAEEQGDLIRVEWSVRHPEGDDARVTYLLRYSHDGGNTWRTIAADLTETRQVVNLDSLPGNEECMFQVVASAGIRSATVQTDPFAVPQKPRESYILSPEPGATFEEGEPVVLRGGAFSPDFETAGFGDAVWTSSVDGYIGAGYDMLTHTLSAGRHTITFGVPDGITGREAVANVDIMVRPSPPQNGDEVSAIEG